METWGNTNDKSIPLPPAKDHVRLHISCPHLLQELQRKRPTGTCGVSKHQTAQALPDFHGKTMRNDGACGVSYVQTNPPDANRHPTKCLHASVTSFLLKMGLSSCHVCLFMLKGIHIVSLSDWRIPLIPSGWLGISSGICPWAGLKIAIPSTNSS